MPVPVPATPAAVVPAAALRSDAEDGRRRGSDCRGSGRLADMAAARVRRELQWKWKWA